MALYLITGPPGSGKSTMLNRILRSVLSRNSFIFEGDQLIGPWWAVNESRVPDDDAYSAMFSRWLRDMRAGHTARLLELAKWSGCHVYATGMFPSPDDELMDDPLVEVIVMKPDFREWCAVLDVRAANGEKYAGMTEADRQRTYQKGTAGWTDSDRVLVTQPPLTDLSNNGRGDVDYLTLLEHNKRIIAERAIHNKRSMESGS